MAEFLGKYRKLYESGMTEGRRVNSVSLEAEAWLWRLMLIADDFGNFPADPDFMSGRAAPKRRLDRETVDRLTDELERAKLLTRYSVDGEEFLCMAEFERLQTPPNGRRVRRYPGDPGGSKGSGVTRPTRPDQTRPDSDQTRSDEIPKATGGSTGSGSGGRAASAREELARLGVNPDVAAQLADGGVKAGEPTETLAEISKDRRVRRPLAVLVRRLSDAHGIKLAKGPSVSKEARALQSAVDRQRGAYR